MWGQRCGQLAVQVTRASSSDLNLLASLGFEPEGAVPAFCARSKYSSLLALITRLQQQTKLGNKGMHLGNKVLYIS